MIVSGYPGLEIIPKLATVLEVEPAELVRMPMREAKPHGKWEKGAARKLRRSGELARYWVNWLGSVRTISGLPDSR